MGYAPTAEWVHALKLNEDRVGPHAMLVAAALTVDHAIAEIEWKMAKDEDFAESSSLARAVDDLRAAAEGLSTLLDVVSDARRLPPDTLTPSPRVAAWNEVNQLRPRKRRPPKPKP